MKELKFIKFTGDRDGCWGWMVSNFGHPEGFKDNEGWRYRIGHYAFYDDKILMAFLLRWPAIVVAADGLYRMVFTDYMHGVESDN